MAEVTGFQDPLRPVYPLTQRPSDRKGRGPQRGRGRRRTNPEKPPLREEPQKGERKVDIVI